MKSRGVSAPALFFCLAAPRTTEVQADKPLVPEHVPSTAPVGFPRKRSIVACTFDRVAQYCVRLVKAPHPPGRSLLRLSGCVRMIPERERSICLVDDARVRGSRDLEDLIVVLGHSSAPRRSSRGRWPDRDPSPPHSDSEGSQAAVCPHTLAL